MGAAHMNRPCELGANQSGTSGAGEDRNLVTDQTGGPTDAPGPAGA